MRKLFLLPAALLALASCSNDAVVEKNPSKVVGENALQIYPAIAGVTRGTVYDNGNFTEFYLTTSASFQTGETTEDPKTILQFENTKVVKNNGAWKIGDQTLWYWPSKSTGSSFTAWAPVTDGNKFTKVDEETKTYDAFPTDLKDLQDIVVAYNKGIASDLSAGVPLKFRHILSQIIIKADNTASDKIKIEVKGTRLKNILTTGKWSLPQASTVDALGYKPWSNLGDAKDYVIDYTSTTLSNGSTTDLTGKNPLLLIPQDLSSTTTNIGTGAGQYLSVLVKITKVSGDAIYPKGVSTGESDYAWAAVDINTEWEPGKKYIYTLHFKEGGYGKVDGDQDDGGNDDPTDGEKDAGDDVEDSPVKLVLDVSVVDWEEVPEAHDM